MAQYIKLSVINETGENLIITVNNNETFAEFQARIIQENNLFVSIEDFQSLDENLNQETIFFECFRKNLNDEDLLNFDGPLFEINLSTKKQAMEEHEDFNYLDIVSQLKEIHNYSEESTDDFCRLCAENLNTLNKITIYNYTEQINNYLPINVQENDGLPQNICQNCENHIKNLIVFTQRVIEAEKVLKLKFNDLKTEPNDIEYFEIEEIEEISNTSNRHCRICDLIIDNLKDAVSHSQQDHRINNLFACVFCEYGFETSASLSQHIQTEHKDFNKYICKICGTLFPYQSMLQKHVCGAPKQIDEHKSDAVNTPEIKTFQCHICGKSLNRLSRLKSHLLTHESNNSIIKNVNCCIDCKECFENEIKAVLHGNTETHTIALAKLNKVFRCEFCEKCYIDTETLKNHRGIHNGLNPFICHICEAQFGSYSRCTSHKTSHGLFKEGGDKQIFPVIKYFLCDSCDNTYLNWTHLTSHKRIKHSPSSLQINKTYTCLDCNLEFPNNYGLTYHRKTKHTEDPIKCSECGENLVNYEAWKEHRLAAHANKKYNYQCVKCEKIFQTPENLEEHLKIHTDLKENKCPYCPSSFADVKDLGTHLKIHRIKKSHLTQNTTKSTDNFRPYSCQDCGLTFRKQFTLKNHQLKHCIKLDKSKFVLMVDDEEHAKVITDENEQTINDVFATNGEEETNEQYIDLGNGNYVKIQPGNTVNIEGKDYVLVNENNDQIMEENINNEINLNLDENVMQVDETNTNQLYQEITYLLTDNHQTFI